jgi:peroxiredoxin
MIGDWNKKAPILVWIGGVILAPVLGVAATDSAGGKIRPPQTTGQQTATQEAEHVEQVITSVDRRPYGQSPEFVLEDQFREKHTLAFPRDRVCVLLFADKEGSKQIEAWVTALYQRYKNAVDVCGVALLKGVPDTLRPTVRFLFKHKVEHPVLMDWDGSVTAKFPCRPKEASVFVVDRQGRIVHTAFGIADTPRLTSACEAIDQLLEAAPTEDALH